MSSDGRASKATGDAVCPTCGMKTMTTAETAAHAKYHPEIVERRLEDA